jgi:uncharacterized membrane protein YeaQ/YmgE (transglycosylase-associated protein family)
MTPWVIWLSIGLAVGLVSLILPHARRGTTSALQVISAVVGGFVFGSFSHGVHSYRYATGHPPGFGLAFLGALIFALAFVWGGSLWQRRRGTA